MTGNEEPTLVEWLRDFSGPGSAGTNEAADVIEQQSKDLAASIRMHEQARRLACAERDRAEVLETGILKALDLIESTDGLDVPAWSVHDILEAALDADADILIRWHSESFGPGTKQEGAQN